LARSLQWDYDRARAGKGETTWETPFIVSFSAWLRRQWTELTFDPPAGLPILLSGRQERLLWTSVIEQFKEEFGLLDTSATARIASHAHALIQAYRIPASGSEYAASDDTAAFERWHAVFRKECARQNWITAAQLPDELARRVSRSGEITLAAFGPLTPQEGEFFAALNPEMLPPLAADPVNAASVQYPDIAAEVDAAAHWARAWLDRDPAARIGILSFDPASTDPLFEEAFRRADPGQCFFARGERLSRLPLAASASRLLDLLLPEISIGEAGLILLSPYLHGSLEELGARAAADARLRQMKGPFVTLRDVAMADECPLFARMLQDWLRRRPDLPREQLPSAWAHEFHALLAAFGWPGDDRLNAEEYFAHEEWREALGEFASFDRVTGPVNARRALPLLRDLLDETIVNAGRADAPIQILPAADTAGASFDCVWLCGAHDGLWPPSASPNPFLPLSLQRRHGTPRVSAAAAFEEARNATGRLLTSASEIVVSCAETVNGVELRLSPLFSHLRAKEANPPVRGFPSAELESIPDEAAPPLPPGPYGGGARLFELQSQCPFRAFAEIRLGAKPLEEPSLGFGPRDRGSALHRALHYCWMLLADSRTLVATPKPDLAVLVEDCVGRALQETWPGRAPLLQRLREVEAERLRDLILHWLTLERRRTLPFHVLEHEREREISLAGLGVKVRADRVDQLDDGRIVILDYKAGEKSAKAWKEKRLSDPQLPLYAVTSGRPVAGLAFALVHPDPKKRKFSGSATANDILPDVKGDLTPRALAEWSEDLAVLAQQFLAGDARVDPAKNACKWCHLPSFCRIRETMSEPGDGD
jgi:probable DNA repair protein